MVSTHNSPSSSPHLSPLAREDWIAVALILMGFIMTVLIMPISRDFALLDDWTYTRAVEKLVAGQGLAPSQYAQATMVSQAYWGAAFALVFGMSFTALTAATMVMSAVAALSFYAILRQLGFSTRLSVLGVAVLALNPYYLYLSYTFMTEITFVALALLSCALYIRGLKGGQGADVWLWAGGLLAALTFLTRQFGLAIPIAALLWLWLAHRLTLGKALAVAALPIASVIGYYVWSSGFGTIFSGSVGREELLALLHPGAWVQRGGRFVYFALFLPGVTVPLWGKIRRWKLALPIAIAISAIAYALWQVKLKSVQRGESTLDELSYTWLQPVFGEPTLIYCVGAGLTVWLIFGALERGWPTIAALVKDSVMGLRFWPLGTKAKTGSSLALAQPPAQLAAAGRQLPLAAFFFLAGIILFAATYLVSAGFLDRYWVPVLPFIIAAGLYGLKGRSWKGIAPVIAIVVAAGIFGALIHLDDYAQTGARWEAGRHLLRQGVPFQKIENGYGWDGYFLYDQSIKRYPNPDVKVIGRIFPPSLVIDPQYVISAQTRTGYNVIDKYPYFSWLHGLSNLDMLALKRSP